MTNSCDENCSRDRVNTLLSGEICCTMCNLWRRECEARYVLDMPSKQQRKDYLYGYDKFTGEFRKGVLKQRGQAAVSQLETDILTQWKFNKESK